MRTLIILPRAFGAMLETNVSLSRLQRFFDLSERPTLLKRLPVVPGDLTTPAISIRRSTFTWTTGSAASKPRDTSTATIRQGSARLHRAQQ